MDNSTQVTNVIIFYVINTTSVLACILAAILVAALQLYKKVVYRLALYQVLSSLALASLEMFQSIYVNYSENPAAYDKVCAAFGWLVYYSQWSKLLFTGWVTLHVFCFGAFQKDLRRLEVLYVATSLLVPILIASVPLITNSYRIVYTTARHYVCYILDAEPGSNAALIERFVLWDCPALIILFASSVAMGAMVIKLIYVCFRSKSEQYRKAIKQFLPLATFPILFFVFIIPGLVFDIHFAVNPTLDTALSSAALVSISLWSLGSGVTLIVHILVARCCAKKKKYKTEAAEATSIHYNDSIRASSM
ncbi:hypothetical protein EMCRGX_G011034 [Ephydatia muelleri]|eukprot:Em0006g1278a